MRRRWLVGSVVVVSLVLALVPAGAQGQAQGSPPPAPAAPTVHDDGLYALTVTWAEPEDVDPAVTGYDLEYRRRGASSWLSGPQDLTATSATITGLEADKNYYVRVRAQNSNGEGAWSQAGEGTTALYVGTLTAGGWTPVETSSYLGYRRHPRGDAETRRRNSFGDLVPRSLTYDGREYQFITLAWCRCPTLRSDGTTSTASIDLYSLFNAAPDEWVLRVEDDRWPLSDAGRADLTPAGLKAYWLHTSADWVNNGEYQVSFSRDPLLSSSGRGTVRGPLTAEMLEVPQTHDGTSAFEFTLSFSEDVANGKDDITGAVLTLVGGSISDASQLRSPSHKEWRVRLQPSGAEDVSIILQADRDCETSGAVCTEDGRRLTETIIKTVTGPQPPQISGQSHFTVTENGTGHVARFTASDPDSRQLTWQPPAGVDAAAFTVDGSGNLRFLHSPDFEAPSDNGADNTYEVTVRVSDGLQVATHDVTVAVTDQNERPTAVDDQARTDEDEPVFVDVLDNDSDPDDGDTLTLRIVTVHNGTARIENDRTVLYTPREDYHGTGRFRYEIRDARGLTATATAEIEIDAVNDAPTFRSPATTRRVPASATGGDNVGAPVTATDVDGDTLTYRLSGTDAALFGIVARSGQLTVADAVTFSTGDTYTVTVEADDPSGATASIDVTITVITSPVGAASGGSGGASGSSGGGGASASGSSGGGGGASGSSGGASGGGGSANGNSGGGASANGSSGGGGASANGSSGGGGASASGSSGGGGASASGSSGGGGASASGSSGGGGASASGSSGGGGASASGSSGGGGASASGSSGGGGASASGSSGGGGASASGSSGGGGASASGSSGGGGASASGSSGGASGSSGGGGGGGGGGGAGSAPDPADEFSDLDEAGVHTASVVELVSGGVMARTGCRRGYLCPNEPLRRWEIAVWLIRVLEGDDPGRPSRSRFEDVSVGQWWAGHVEQLAQRRITLGCSSEPRLFCPNDTVTRGQMAAFLVRAFELAEADPVGFEDTVDSVFEADIDALFAAGITVGCSAETLLYCPQQPTTRAQMARFLTRAINNQD